MYRNYIRIAFRNLLKQKTFTFINMVGLAIGMTCFVLILLYLKLELSYDTYHESSDRIYRVALARTYPDKVRLWGRTALPLAKTLQQEYDEVAQATRLLGNNNALLIKYGDKSIEGNRVLFADRNIFEVFSFPLIHGDARTALSQQNSAVMTQEAANKFFGQEDAMGKTLTINNQDYVITGVSEDVPENSHFHYDFLLSADTIPFFDGQEWINNWGAYTYILLHEGFEAEILETRLAQLVTKYMAPEVVDEVKTSFAKFVEAGNGYQFFLQPLQEIHLKSSLAQELEANGNIMYVYLFSIIAIFVLSIACINFMNLATARSASRAKEVGVRKTLGSGRPQLMAQFLLESLLLSGLALLLTIGLVWVLLPYFNNIAGKQLEIDYLGNLFVLPGLIGFTLFVGLLAGSYPALFLSSFRPISVLKGDKQKGANRTLRNGLVIFQFAISIILIIGTFVVDGQIDYVLSKDLGFDKAHVLVVKNARLLNQQVAAFKQELLTNSNIISASGSFNFPAAAFDGNVHLPEGASDDKAVSMSMIFADYDYPRTMGMEVLQGRNYSEAFSTDSAAYVLNETAVKMLGLTTPINARITDRENTRHIIGVLKDFHFKSLHNPISPLIYAGNNFNRANFLSVRIQPGQIPETLSFVENKWREFTGEQPFAWSFLDDDLAAQYEAEQATRELSRLFSGLAILIGCLGLFGLAAFTAEQRTKEIGVRKVLGASIPNIVFLLVKEFTRLVAVAFVIASPVAYFVTHQWLQTFAYKTGMPLPAFILAGVLALGIALLTVSYQAIRAALPNPVQSLRYE